MKCTDRKYYRRRINRKRQLRTRLIIASSILLSSLIVSLVLLGLRSGTRNIEDEKYRLGIYQSDLFAKDLCVSNEEIRFEEFERDEAFYGALLFNVETKEVLYTEHIHERLFPASTTKIMTTYVALKYGNVDDVVTVSKNATMVPSDSSKAGLKEGDQLTLYDLLYGLILPSGNDSAVAVAEHVAGSVEGFAKLMNEEAKRMGATRTHYVNAHGYHEEDHYTTAYDLYLIFQECLKDHTFREIVSAKEWTAQITGRNGVKREVRWENSNQFLNGMCEMPSGISVLMGKTGNTSKAGKCLVLYVETDEGTPYIAILMGVSTWPNLYINMTQLLQAIPK